MSSPYQKAYFLLSVATMSQLPPDTGIEVAIVGRSNAGKSSILNRITKNKGLARVSKTPGRTQLVNLFALDDTHRLTDLPGYGYAKVPLLVKLKWQKVVDEYINERLSLKGLILVMDIRHPLRDLDVQLLDYCEHRGLAVHLILNKADKLSKNEAANTLFAVKDALKDYQNAISLQTFSALKGTGLEELYTVLNNWYEWNLAR